MAGPTRRQFCVRRRDLRYNSQMKRADYAVDVLDATGQIIGQKPRYKIDKRVDIFHGVHVILLTPEGNIVLSRIPQREDLPNLYAGLLGTTMAAVRRHDELAEEAAKRNLSKELLLEDPRPELLYDRFLTLSDGRLTHLTAYTLITERPGMYRNLNIGELVPMDPQGVAVAMTLHPDRFAPTFKAVWPDLEPWVARLKN